MEVLNAEGKWVCDITEDNKTVIIKKHGCATYITANPDGTLKVANDDNTEQR